MPPFPGSARHLTSQSVSFSNLCSSGPTGLCKVACVHLPPKPAPRTDGKADGGAGSGLGLVPAGQHGMASPHAMGCHVCALHPGPGLLSGFMLMESTWLRQYYTVASWPWPPEIIWLSRWRTFPVPVVCILRLHTRVAGTRGWDTAGLKIRPATERNRL